MVDREPLGAQRIYDIVREWADPFVCNANFVQLFECVPEVFWPIDFIASRCAGATYRLHRYADDAIVWDNEQVNSILAKPNAIFTWYQLVYQHIAYKLCTGNAYLRAAADRDAVHSLWRYCRHYWELPADAVTIEVQRRDLPVFGACDIDDIVKWYYLAWGLTRNNRIDPREVMHDREVNLGCTNADFLYGKSRLASVLKAISNIIAVYEARNVIYVKRGGLGWLVSAAKDEMGSRPLTHDEKRDILDQMQMDYGLTRNKSPYGVSDAPLSFVRTNMSISELEPFEETLADAIAIAGAFGIPSVLIPRKDQSTFSNQATAEKAVYTSVIIPMVRRFCEDVTHFLGLDADGLYIDANFDEVDCLQSGKKEAQEVHKLIADRCRDELNAGIITLNDWRIQQGYERIDNALYNTLAPNLTPEQRAELGINL